jgi:hypothetical protein
LLFQLGELGVNANFHLTAAQGFLLNSAGIQILTYDFQVGVVGCGCTYEDRGQKKEAGDGSE